MTELANILTAGDTLDFSTSVPDYPASAGWVLKHHLAPRDSGGAAIDFTATASSDDYRTQIAASSTAAWVAGYYTWSSYVERSGERYTVGRGQLQIRASSVSMAVGTDDRTHARKVLDSIEAVIANRATMDQQEYAINGRSLKRTPVLELIKLRNLYRNEVLNEQAAERLAAGLGGGGNVRVRF